MKSGYELDGHWYARKDGCAVYKKQVARNSEEAEVVFNRESLEWAIQNVKNSRGAYVTEEAFQEALAHFTRGLMYIS